MYGLRYSNKFKKDFKKIKRNPNFRISEFENIVAAFLKGVHLSWRYKEHKLHGEWKNCYECHMRPDILLIYEVDENNQIIYMLRIGSHAELF